jgi:hypothetical protein
VTAKHRAKSNGLTFSPLENRVAPMVIKLAESLERTVAGQAGGGDGDSKHAVMKLAKQLKKTVERGRR